MSICVCVPGTYIPRYCPKHWQQYTLDAIEAGAAKANAAVDQLARDRETATKTLDVMRALVLESVEHDPGLTVLIERIWENLAPVAVEHVVVKTKSIAVIDERGPGSTVDLVDERG